MDTAQQTIELTAEECQALISMHTERVRLGLQDSGATMNEVRRLTFRSMVAVYYPLVARQLM